LPGLRRAEDVSDWLARHGTVERLGELAARALADLGGLGRRAPAWKEQPDLVFAAGLDPLDKLVLLACWYYAAPAHREDGGTVPATGVTAAALAALCGVHRVTAQRVLARLRAAGLLRRLPEGHAVAWDVLAARAAVAADGAGD